MGVIRSLEEYKERVRDWYQRVTPFCVRNSYGMSGTLWAVQFLTVEYENMFINQMRKEICLETIVDELLKEYKRTYRFYVMGWRDSFTPTRRSVIETWFKENTEGVSPWRKVSEEFRGVYPKS